MKQRLIAAVLSGLFLLPAGSSLAQSKQQTDKNLMRNLGIGIGAVAAHKAIKGKGTEALLYGGAAAYAGKKYEDQRKAQNSKKLWRSYRTKNGKRVGYWVMRGNSRVRYVKFG